MAASLGSQQHDLFRETTMFRFLLLLAYVSSTAVFASVLPRIVSSGASVTEIIYALDKQDLIVATDSTSVYPPAAAALPKLGYFRQLSVEGVLSFQPTLLIGAHATGPASLQSQLVGAGLQVEILPEQRNVQGLYQQIRQIGEILDAPTKSQALIDTIASQLDVLKVQVLAEQQKQGRKLNALFILSNGERGLTVAGNNTIPQALFDDAGLNNVAADLLDYKVMDNESILAAKPDLLFVASHQVRDPQALQSLCQHVALKGTAAGRECQITVMDSSVALGLSPRYPEALSIIINRAKHANYAAD